MNAPALSALQKEIEAVSEKYWCAAWRSGIEFFVWDRLQGMELVRGNLPLADEEVARLRALSVVLGGWVVNTHDGVSFIPLDGWLELHRRYRAGERVESILDSLPTSS